MNNRLPKIKSSTALYINAILEAESVEEGIKKALSIARSRREISHLSRLCGISDKTLRKYAQDEGFISLDYATAILKAMGLTLFVKIGEA